VAPFAAAEFARPVHHRRIDYGFVGSPFRQGRGLEAWPDVEASLWGARRAGKITGWP
jgi:hypothetical protein